MATKDAVSTQDTILDVAERLFAEHGVDEVSLAQINREAGQKNRSAINYHFGSKQKLLLAILARHEATLETERLKLLEKFEAAGRIGAREVAIALVQPIAVKLEQGDAGHAYLLILSQLVGHPELSIQEQQLTAITTRSDSLSQLFLRARQAIGGELWTARSILVTGLLFHSLADYARLSRSENPRLPVPSPAVFIDGLIDGITALIEAPVTGVRQRTSG